MRAEILPSDSLVASSIQVDAIADESEESGDTAGSEKAQLEKTLKDVVTPLWRLDYSDQLKVFINFS